MSPFGVNVLLAFSWAALTSDFSFTSIVVGYLIGFAALWVVQPLYQRKSPYFLRSWRLAKLIVTFIKDLFVSSLRVAWDVLTPQDLSEPAIIEMPLDVEGELQILLVTNLISLTPGTLSLDISPDRKTLYVHAMFAHDPEALVRELKEGVERQVMEVFES
ncbi:Na+/H+ antiporter subunit E [Qingshengfaniella alkalisoli]|uniref:Sodium:proton antiporter n=1 Tax=Qingshengfaniella alkalisoli TaxID=2599296 RepID=A0A5B8I8H7_9RHOB|nr:Na+/H+ antiporter subunit E [Qingshengfaniella alkalisoli]QDY70079.1 sodium:proton antiporter [Qingshengfaniella alkalisoli]